MRLRYHFRVTRSRPFRQVILHGRKFVTVGLESVGPESVGPEALVLKALVLKALIMKPLALRALVLEASVLEALAQCRCVPRVQMLIIEGPFSY